MVKAINAWGSQQPLLDLLGGTTDQFYRMEIFDFKGLKNKIYFNYPGAPAPALTDSSAFATCP
jgi:hypothetical protein